MKTTTTPGTATLHNRCNALTNPRVCVCVCVSLKKPDLFSFILSVYQSLWGGLMVAILGLQFLFLPLLFTRYPSLPRMGY